MNLKKRLEAVTDEVVKLFGLELVGTELKGEGRSRLLRVTIDKEGGVSLDHCLEVSRQLGAVLDAEDLIHGSYRLEVSSPGLDRPLKHLKDFEKSVGKLIKLVSKEKINSQNHFIGRLSRVSHTSIVLETEKKETEISFDNIQRAKLEIEIK